MRKTITRIILIAAIPLAFIFGVLIGLDVNKGEVQFYRTAAMKTVEVYGATIDTASQEMDVLLDINQGKIPVKEGEEKLRILREQMLEHKKAQEELNAELEAL